MKKILIAILLLLAFSGCKKAEEPVEVTAKNILPQAEISDIIGYVPQEEEKITRSCKEITYRGETKGANDIVNVKVYPPNERNSREDLKKKYDDQKKKYEKYSSVVETGADDSFIAFPCIYLYKNGYYVIITAGSGAEDAQVAMLKNLAQVAEKNIDLLAPEEEPEDDNADGTQKEEPKNNKK